MLRRIDELGYSSRTRWQVARWLQHCCEYHDIVAVRHRFNDKALKLHTSNSCSTLRRGLLYTPICKLVRIFPPKFTARFERAGPGIEPGPCRFEKPLFLMLHVASLRYIAKCWTKGALALSYFFIVSYHFDMRYIDIRIVIYSYRPNKSRAISDAINQSVSS